MSLMVAPYNDSMRLGMGFNSYTQTMCIDKAVAFSAQQLVRSENPSQVVTYSSKCVNKLSDIVKSMNVSYSTSIKKGTVEVAGSNNTINEEKIKQSDINAVVSVKVRDASKDQMSSLTDQVVNQTTIVDETATFQPVKGILPGSTDFNERFGDCYISGFIEGGDFNGIVSMRVLDRSKTDEVVSRIKKSVGSSGNKNEFTLDMDSFSNDSTASEVDKDTESTVSVAWMGGGQVKDPKEPWNMTSVYAAAAAFPSKVALIPQKTWAILTKYKANRSFVETFTKLKFSPLEYDLVAGYTAELFDNYMEYKQLLKQVEDITAGPQGFYAQTWKSNAIPLVVTTLTAVKSAFRIEMSKIVKAVDVLSRDPHALKRNTSMDSEPADELVRRIVRQAIGNMHVSSVLSVQPDPSTTSQQAMTEDGAAATVSEPSGGATAIESQACGNSAQQSEADMPEEVTTTPVVEDFNPQAMIAPEIWSDLLPLPVDTNVSLNSGAALSAMPSSLAELFPPAPDSDKDDLKHRGGQEAVPTKQLQILSAAVGASDFTDKLRKMVKDNKLSFQASALQGMVAGQTPPLPSDVYIQLAFVYQYGDGPMRVCVVKAETSNGNADTTKSISITPDTTEYATVQPTAWNADTWSICALVYGGKHVTDSTILNKLQDRIRTNFNGGKGARWTGNINNSFVGEDPWSGKCKSAMVFYQATEGGSVRNTISLEDASRQGYQGLLTDRAIPDIVDPKFLPGAMQVPVLSSGIKVKCTRISTRDFRLEQASASEPFIRFQNGVRFCWQTDNNLVVYQGNDVKWSSGTQRSGENVTARVLVWQADNKLCGYDPSGNCTICLNA
ncbi:hypothetical protein KC332_g8113 [Hortaea werneckii]|nr:hypothetical protein KC358_g7858 [Hortaea werneckii]KAI6830329.1 hypothetical protein KC350_g7625 [Hortaea werneckii]KAI6834536.1 hypothetical protein KC342_g6235 [Hortaea werneckii]KAI6927588.1 hypothetical protein KC348_g8361 [Hortaea werneckii]KAI6934310.1 hypothetical protein KC341_g7692 [Hortaea werneckii]